MLSDSSDHPDVESVHQRAAEIDPRISIATVYRTVRLFEEANILARHDFGDGRSRYEEMPSDHHDHLIDLQTGRVIEFKNEVIERLQRRLYWFHDVFIVNGYQCSSGREFLWRYCEATG